MDNASFSTGSLVRVFFAILALAAIVLIIVTIALWEFCKWLFF